MTEEDKTGDFLVACSDANSSCRTMGHLVEVVLTQEGQQVTLAMSIGSLEVELQRGSDRFNAAIIFDEDQKNDFARQACNAIRLINQQIPIGIITTADIIEIPVDERLRFLSLTKRNSDPNQQIVDFCQSLLT